jgi:hypothetical protein
MMSCTERRLRTATNSDTEIAYPRSRVAKRRCGRNSAECSLRDSARELRCLRAATWRVRAARATAKSFCQNRILQALQNGVRFLPRSLHVSHQHLRASTGGVTMPALRSAPPSPELHPYVRAYAQRVLGSTDTSQRYSRVARPNPALAAHSPNGRCAPSCISPGQ